MATAWTDRRLLHSHYSCRHFASPEYISYIKNLTNRHFLYDIFRWRNRVQNVLINFLAREMLWSLSSSSVFYNNYVTICDI